MKRDDPVVAAINQSAVQLRARRVASLADPNTPLWKRKLLEARPPPPGSWKTQCRSRRGHAAQAVVASVIGQMKQAGLDIAGCEIDPREGTVKIVTGKPVEATTPDTPDSNEWDGVLQ